MCERKGRKIAPGMIVFGPRGANRTGDGDTADRPLAGGPGKADFVAEAKRFFEREILPITTANIGPDGRYFIPPRLIEDYRRLIGIAKKRERGFVRLIEVLRRYRGKIAELKDAESLRAT